MSPDGQVKETAGIKVSVSDVTGAKKSVTVEVPASQVAAEYDSQCRKYARNLKVPGFRQGKVPPHIIRQRYGRELEQEAVEHVIEHTLSQAVSEQKLQPLRAPVLKDYKYQKGEPLTFTAEFEVRPKVSPAGVDGLKVKLEQPVVTDAMVSETLTSLRERAARYDPVEGRGVEPGDFVVMDVSGKFAPGEGEDFARENLMIETGSGGPHPELTDDIRGMTPGETREFAIGYPADHQASELAGKRVDYKVTAREIKKKTLPELDDEFARDLGKFETLEELKTRVTEDLTERERRRARDAARSEIVEQLLKANPEVPVPDVMVDEEVDRRVDDFVRTMIMQGMDPRRHQIDWDDIREKQRDPATRSARAMILLDAIAEEKEITLEPEALDRAIAHEAGARRQTPEAFRAKLTKDGRLESLRQQLLREKVLDFLVSASNT